MSDIQQPLPKINDFKEEDILYLLISEEPDQQVLKLVQSYG
ncbi:MAG: hypothetical protein AB1861_25170 [Cyanobacteriota bacterium]